ncbi:hypothetical protein CEK25_010471 [Fusarium fujikuroi]|nr:hypothetical protein CEK25_010471 [Fusarium fujikuroi]
MNFLRNRLPAPKQDLLAKQARQQGTTDAAYKPSRISELSNESPSWYKSAARRHLYFLLFPACVVSYATSGYDGSMMNSLQTVSYWDDFFDNPRGSQLGLMSAIMSLGSICSTPIAPFVADKYGRRWGITTGSIIMIAGAILQCESTNFAMFVVSRFILGFGLSFATTASPSMVSELSHPKDRVTITAICNTCWFLGSIAAAWITYGTRVIPSTWSWRIPSLLQMAPSLIQLSTVWFLPESPRWLISNDRSEEALEALTKYHGEGVKTELVELEYEEIRAAIEQEKLSGQTTWKSMVSTKGNRYRMFLVICMGLMSQWSGNGLISYYLSRVMDTVGITNKKTQALVNGLINIWNWALALTSACFVDRVGRRPLFRISTIGMLLVFTGWTIASERFAATEAKSAGVAVMALIFVYEIFYCMAFSPLPVAYSVEVFPYSIRAKGMGVYVLATKCAVFVNQYVNPVGLDSIGWRYYLVYVAVLLVESFIAYGWFLETKGKALEEIAVIFDGEAADVTVDEPTKSKVFSAEMPTTLEQENVDRKLKRTLAPECKVPLSFLYYLSPTSKMSSSSQAKARAQARSIRKGTHSCWECRRRKIRCQFSAPDDLVCRPCGKRGSICRGQEFADESEASQLSMRHLARRLGRLEELMEKLAERSALCPSTGISTQHSPGISHVVMDELEYPDAPTIRDPVRLGTPTIPRSHYTTSSLISGTMHETTMDLAGPSGLAETLYKLFPSQIDVNTIFEASVGPLYVTTLFHRQADVAEGNSEPPEAVGVIPSPSSRPTLLAKRLLQLVICMQQLSPRFNRPLPSLRASMLRTMEEIVDGVDKFISANRVVSTLEGLECLLLLGYWQQNAGNLRKAWLIFRQALSVGQLMGIDAGAVAPPDTSFSTRYPPSPQMLWFRSVACDRYLSLLLDLPAGSHDNSFAAQQLTVRDSPSEKLEKLHAVVSEKMIERNNSTQVEAYSLTQLISSDLMAGQGLMGDSWWEVPLVNTEQSPASAVEVASRLIMQMSHHLLLVLLHIPYLLRNPLFPHDQQNSKTICTSSSRNILDRFRVFRSFNDSAYACRHVDYAALVAAMTLLVSHAQNLEVRDPTNGQNMHRITDRALIIAVKDRMKHLSYLNGDKFFEESTNVIEKLLPLLSSPETESPTFDPQCSPSVELKIPYFGVITIVVPPVPASVQKAQVMERVEVPAPRMDGVTLSAGLSHPESKDLESLVPVHFHPEEQRNTFGAVDVMAGADEWAMQGIDATYWALLQCNGVFDASLESEEDSDELKTK